jgi:hypothetical protein
MIRRILFVCCGVALCAQSPAVLALEHQNVHLCAPAGPGAKTEPPIAPVPEWGQECDRNWRQGVPLGQPCQAGEPSVATGKTAETEGARSSIAPAYAGDYLPLSFPICLGGRRWLSGHFPEPSI